MSRSEKTSTPPLEVKTKSPHIFITKNDWFVKFINREFQTLLPLGDIKHDHSLTIQLSIISHIASNLILLKNLSPANAPNYCHYHLICCFSFETVSIRWSSRFFFCLVCGLGIDIFLCSLAEYHLMWTGVSLWSVHGSLIVWNRCYMFVLFCIW